MTLPLNIAGEAPATAAGVATVTFTAPSDQRWLVTRCAVSCTVADPMPEARVYLGSSAIPSALLGGTYTGALDVGLDSGQQVGPGQTITVQWTGAAPGASCSAVLGGQVLAP